MKKFIFFIGIFTSFYLVYSSKEQKIYHCALNYPNGAFEICFLFDNNTLAFSSQYVNMEIPYTLFNLGKEKEYMPDLSPVSEKKYKIFDINKEIEVLKFSKDIKLFSLEEEIYGFNFFHNSSIKLFQSGFTFAFKVSSREFSLVHRLKEERLIDHLSFTFYPIGKSKGHLYFGLKNHGLFFYPKLEPTGAGTCKVDKKYSTWGCKLKAVSYDSEEKNIFAYNDYVSFQSNRRESVFSCALVDYVYQVMIKPFFKSSCIIDVIGNFKVISCTNPDILRLSSKINFIFDEFVISLEIKIFFNCFHQSCFSLFKCYPDKNESILGAVFLQKFISTFDYEDEVISFSSVSPESEVRILEKEKEKEKKPVPSNKSMIMVLFLINIISMSLMIIIIALKEKSGTSLV